MKIAISSLGQTLADQMDARFGRTAYFLIVDSETMQFTVLDNSAAAASGGAGIAAAQSVIDQQVEAIITGQLGPNAMDILQSTDIELYQGRPDSALNNMVAWREHKLPRISGCGPAHAGMGNRGGRV